MQCWPPFVEGSDAGGMPRPACAEGRPLREIVRQPGFATTVFSGAVAYMVMNFLMTAAPLSMHMHGLSQQAANLGIQWHVMAMPARDFHRPADPALRRSAHGGGGIADHRRVAVAVS